MGVSSSVIAWYDASASESLTLSGSEVIGWDDISGNGLHVQKNTGVSGPSIDNTSFSKNSLNFDSSRALFLPTVFVGGNNWTIWMVYHRTAGASSYHSLGVTRSNGVGNSIQTGAISGGCFIYGAPPAPGSIYISAPSGQYAYKSNVVGSYGSVASTSANAAPIPYVDGSSVLPWTDIVVAASAVQYDRIGCDYSGVYSSGGSIAEIAIFDRVLDPQEIADLQVYAETKWGIPSSGLISSGGNPIFTAYKIIGNTKDVNGENAARLVAAFRRDPFSLVGTATSDEVTGDYKITVPTNDEHVVIGVPDPSENRNAIIWDHVIPVDDV